MNPQPFFDFIQERYRIFLKKQTGEPRPWTDDDILGYYKFTNVFREDDRTTVWFRENVRDPLRDQPGHVLLSTVVFRWFNRISTGEAHFLQKDMFKNAEHTAYYEYFLTGSGQALHDACFKYNGPMGPHVTGAYIIKTPNGMTKLSGVCWALEHFHRDKYPLQFRDLDGTIKKVVLGWQGAAELMSTPGYVITLEQAWDWLRKFSYLGDFMAYEIVTDLRFTCLLQRAPDIMTWANAGPGAMRGLNRLHGRQLGFSQKKDKWNTEMKELLDMSPTIWPWYLSRPLEMREIEHSLCEFDKYQRVDKGEGKPRGVYR